ncbi:MAG: HEPN domain-containing protein [Prevotella sp.]|nr:HEPN domain-containing protein [Prevotella sp.]
MSLSDIDRRTIVGLQMEKANHFLQQADMMCDLQQWDIAANRFYYACFHAVQALFIQNRLASRRHSGMLSQFGLHFIKTGIIDDRLGAFLHRMEQLREKGDYNCQFSVEKEELLSFVSPAHELISVIQHLINNDNSGM